MVSKGPRYIFWFCKVRYLKGRAGATIIFGLAALGLVGYGSWKEEMGSHIIASEVKIRGDLHYLTPERLNDWISNRMSLKKETWEVRELVRVLSEHPWVHQVSVKKLPGQRISVWIEETNPIALVLLEKFYYLGKSGGAFEAVTTAEEISLPVVRGLPPEEWARVRTGRSSLAAEAAGFVLDWSATPEVASLPLSEMRWSEAVGWVLYLARPPLQVVVGEVLGQKTIYRFARVWGEVVEGGRLPVRIDLDYSDRAVVKWKG